MSGHPNGAMHDRGERQMIERAIRLVILRVLLRQIYVYGEASLLRKPAP